MKPRSSTLLPSALAVFLLGGAAIAASGAFVSTAPLGAQEEEDEDPDELGLGLRAALDDLRENDPERAERLRARFLDGDASAWRELDEHREFLERLEDAPPRVRKLMVRDQRYDLAVREEARAFRGAPSADKEEALRMLIDDWFDVRQDLRRARLEELRREIAEFEEPDEPGEHEALDWLVGALEEANEEALYALREDYWVRLGEAMETVDERRAEWWFEIVESDPEGVPFALESWRESDPEAFDAALASAGAGLRLVQAEAELLGYVVENELGADEADEQAEQLMRGPRGPELRPLLERLVRLDRELLLEERRELERRARELPQEIEMRDQMRPLLVTAELLRRTGREDVLEW